MSQLNYKLTVAPTEKAKSVESSNLQLETIGTQPQDESIQKRMLSLQKRMPIESSPTDRSDEMASEITMQNVCAHEHSCLEEFGHQPPCQHNTPALPISQRQP